MRIIGPEELVFGIDDIPACRQFLVDYGLDPVNETDAGVTLEALDGTGITLRARDDRDLPPPLPTATMLRKTIYGVEDRETLDAIRQEVSRDRDIGETGDGGLEFLDDSGFVLGFRVTTRRKLDLPAERINSPGAEPGRAENEVAVDETAPCKPRTLSHVVYFVPDQDKAKDFYIDRLGFVVTDNFSKTGPFLRPQANHDHHTLFLIQTPEYMRGLEHLAFHMQGPTELMLAGSRMIENGYDSFWGPGRHKFGSNWFWYFNSPLGTHVEFDADMDIHNDEWVPRETAMSAETSQVFLFEHREKWAPGGPLPNKKK